MDKVKEMILTELPKEEVALLRFMKQPFKVFVCCDELDESEYPEVVVKVLKEVA